MDRDMSKPYEIVVVDGEELRDYGDGTLRNEKGQVQKSSTERARELQRARSLKSLGIAEGAIKKAAKTETWEEGWEKVLMQRVKVALSNDQRPGNDAAKMIAQALGVHLEQRSVDVSGEVKHRPALPEIPPEMRELILRVAELKRGDGEVVEGETKDVGDDDE